MGFETTRIFGSHPIGFEADNAYLVNKANEQKGILPIVHAWDIRSAEQVIAAGSRLLAIDSLHTGASEFGVIYTLPADPSMLRYDGQDTYVLLGDVTSDDFLFPRVSGSPLKDSLRRVHVQMESGWLGEDTVNRTLNQLTEFETFFCSLLPDERLSRDTEILQRYRRLVHPPSYTAEPTILRNALVQLKVNDAEEFAPEPLNAATILFGNAHKLNEESWENKEVLESRIRKVIGEILGHYFANGTENKDLDAVVAELQTFFAKTGLIRLVDAQGSNRLVDQYKAVTIYNSPTIVRIIESAASDYPFTQNR